MKASTWVLIFIGLGVAGLGVFLVVRRSQQQRSSDPLTAVTNYAKGVFGTIGGAVTGALNTTENVVGTAIHTGTKITTDIVTAPVNAVKNVISSIGSIF